MTDPKLGEARIAEAKRRTEIDRKGSVSWSWKDTFANHLASLYEQDWRPEPEVDAVTLAHREHLLREGIGDPGAVRLGAWDNTHFSAAFRAGHAHALATCADVRRMDWLEGHIVAFAAHGDAFRRDPGDPEPLCDIIDRAMEGGQ